MIEFGELAGVDTFSEGLGALTSSTLRKAIFVLLKHAGAPYPVDEVGARMTPAKLVEAREAVLSAWLASMPEPEPIPEGEDPNPVRAEPPKLTKLTAWAMSRYDLGLPTEEWLSLTPRHVHALRLRLLARMQIEEHLAGTVAAASANFGMCRPDPPLSASQFMLHPYPEPEPEPITGEYLQRAFATFEKTK
jgi:hypothetical protein